MFREVLEPLVEDNTWGDELADAHEALLLNDAADFLEEEVEALDDGFLMRLRNMDMGSGSDQGGDTDDESYGKVESESDDDDVYTYKRSVFMACRIFIFNSKAPYWI